MRLGGGLGDRFEAKGRPSSSQRGRERERNRYSLHPSSMASNLLAATSDALHPSSNGLQPVRERERESGRERDQVGKATAFGG